MLITEHYKHLDVGVDELVLTFYYMEATGFSLAHNRIPMVPLVFAELPKDAEGPSPECEITLRATVGASELFNTTPLKVPSLQPGRSHVLEPLELTRVPVSETLESTTSRPGDLEVFINAGHQSIAERVDIEVLAPNEWFNSPPYFESLCAFIQPNDPSVQPVLDKVANRLKERTGNSSINGYQGGTDRAIAIAAAIYEILHETDIRYINPPASFENTGQRIRSSSEVLNTRFGTCVDLSLAFAAVAEQCGLHPVIMITEGHALTGILASTDQLPKPVIYEPAVINNYLRSGRVLPIDANYYTEETFAETVENTRAQLRVSDVYGLIDVVGSHRDGIRPLPQPTNAEITLQQILEKSPASPEFSPITTTSAKQDGTGPGATKLEEGETSPVTAKASSRSTERLHEDPTPETWELPAATPAATTTETGPRRRREAVDDSPARVQKWKRELLDLSLRNRLLNMKANAEVLPLILPDGALADLDDKIHAGTKIAIHPEDDVSDNRRLQGIDTVTGLPPPEQLLEDLSSHDRAYAKLTEYRYSRFFKNLVRNARTYLEETGSTNLHLALGSLVHKTSTGTLASAPLFLIPVKIVGGAGKSRYRIQVDSTSVASPNYCLVEWLKSEHGVAIDALSHPPLDASGLDIAHALEGISEALVEAQLPFTVKDTAHLMIARFSTYGMWKDLRDHWQTMMNSSVFRHLSVRAGHDFLQPGNKPPIHSLTVNEAQLPLPIPADGAQMQAVKAAAEGYSFVLEGPPGTGKSQTITNLIAHSLDEGKKVLFVAEKQAALEVVKQRLDEIGLGPFTLNLHGGEQTPQKIKDQLKASIDTDVYYNFNAWDNAVTNMRSRLAPLLEYPGKIHDANGAGYSLWSAASALTDAAGGSVAQLTEAFVAEPPVPVETVRETVRDLAAQARVTDFSAVGRWSLVGTIDETAFLPSWERLEQSRVAITESPILRQFLTQESARTQLEEAAAAEAISTGQPNALNHLDVYKSTVSRLESVLHQIRRLHSDVGDLGAWFSVEFIQMGDPQPILDAVEQIRSSRFRRKKRLQEYYRLLNATLREDVTADVEEEHLPERIEFHFLRLPQLRQVGDSIRRTLDEIPMTEALRGRAALDPTLPQAIEEKIEELNNTLTIAQNHRPALELLQDMDNCGLDSKTRAQAREAIAAWDEWLKALGATEASVEAWAQSLPIVTVWLQNAPGWAEDISAHGSSNAHRISQWTHSAEKLNSFGLHAFRRQIESGSIPPNELEMAFQRGLEVASVAERSAHSMLQDFHAEIRENELSQLVKALERVRKEIRLALPARLLERRPYKSGHLDGQTAVLRRQLEATRNPKSFQSLLQEFGKEILTLAPCFFVSPSSLSTYVAPGAIDFDVVVFDEASQITVDQAMGALRRAKSAVIVGDSKQMPPTRIGKTQLGDSVETSGEHTDADPMADIDDLESILSEAVESGLPQLWLSWHYRSKDESLISFSNEHYYEGKLSSLSSPGSIPGAGVHIRRVDGQFIRDKKAGKNKSGSSLFRTNPVEAEAIVDSVTRRVNNPLTGTDSIGIVTFNIQQRDLILDLLEQSDDPLVRKRLEPGPDGLFVKNLENVQGDERDVILFSAAFSKPEEGGPLPLNFGPLTRQGGERRLNVAVTRARKEVELFCSFDPRDIDLQRTRSVGLAHLRDYLEAGLAENLHTNSRSTGTGRSLNINEMRDDIARRLRQRGWEVATDYGQSTYTLDLVVRPVGASRWHAAILTDGEKWAELPTVTDRDLTPTLLESLMDWGAAIRVWLPEWLAGPTALIDRVEGELRAAGDRIREQEKLREEALTKAAAALDLERAEFEDAEKRAEEEGESVGYGDLDAAGVGDSGNSSEPEGVQWTELPEDTSDTEQRVDILTATYLDPEPQEAASGAAENSAESSSALTTAVPDDGVEQQEGGSAEYDHSLPTEVAYVELPTDRLGHITELDREFPRDRVIKLRKVLAQLIQDCGPIELGTLQTSLARRFGRVKTSRTFNKRVDKLLPKKNIWYEPETGLGFVWPTPAGPEDWPHYRRSFDRDLEQISLHEIRNVIRVLSHDKPWLLENDERVRKELARRVLTFFGLQRVTMKVRERINHAVEGL